MAEPTETPVMPARRDMPQPALAWPTRWVLLTMLIAAFLGAMLMVLSPIALFVIDAIWVKHLAEPRIQVLKVDLKEEQEKQQEKAQW